VAPWLHALRCPPMPLWRWRGSWGVRSRSCCADLRRGRWSNPTDGEQVVPQYLRYPAQNPTEGAPIRALGSVQGALFTQHEGGCAGWLRNSGISGAGTMGQGAETVGSYTGGAGVAGFHLSPRDQRQVRTLETSGSVRRSAAGVSVITGVIGVVQGGFHAQKEGRGGRGLGGGWRSERDVRRNERDALQGGRSCGVPPHRNTYPYQGRCGGASADGSGTARIHYFVRILGNSTTCGYRASHTRPPSVVRNTVVGPPAAVLRNANATAPPVGSSTVSC